MWRSKDHRSAGLWWSLLSSGGGHGRFLKSSLILIIIFCSSWCCRGLLCDEVHRDQWTKEITSLPFIITHFSWYWFGRPWEISWSFQPLPHPLRHLLQLAPPQIILVTEFAVDRWIIRRGPLGGVEDQLFSTFLGFGWFYRGPFFLEPWWLSVG